MMSCSRACVLSSPRALALSCSHALMLSGSPAVMPSCSRASKLSYRKESGNALLFFLWLLVSSSLTPSPAPSLSQAKAYAPSVTRFPFLLVQVSRYIQFREDVSRAVAISGGLKCSQRTSSRRAPKEAPRALKEAPRGSQRRSKSTK